MRDSVPSPRYSAICNVLRQWKTLLIPTLESTDSMISRKGIIIISERGVTLCAYQYYAPPPLLGIGVGLGRGFTTELRPRGGGY